MSRSKHSNAKNDPKELKAKLQDIRKRGNMTKALTQAPTKEIKYEKHYPAPKQVSITIPPEIHAEIMYYVNKSNVEISGLGRIVRDSNGNMVVNKIYLIEQENSAASTDLSEEAVSKLLFESRKDEGALNFWWHSHVNMDVFWSGTDLSTISQFGRNGYLVATVFNKKGEMRSAYFQGAGEFLPEVFVDKIQTNVCHVPKKSSVDEWEKQFNEKCKTKSWGTGHGHGYGYGYGRSHYGFGFDDDGDYFWGDGISSKRASGIGGNVKDQKVHQVADIKNTAKAEESPYLVGPSTKLNVSELWDEYYLIVQRCTDFEALAFEEFDVISDIWCFLNLSISEYLKYEWTLESLKEVFDKYCSSPEMVNKLLEDLGEAEDTLLSGETALTVTELNTTNKK